MKVKTAAMLGGTTDVAAVPNWENCKSLGILKVRVQTGRDPRLPRLTVEVPVTFVGKTRTGTVWFRARAPLTHHIVCRACCSMESSIILIDELKSTPAVRLAPIFA